MSFFEPIILNIKDTYKQKNLIRFMMKSESGAFFFKSFVGKSWYLIDSILNILIYYFLISIIYKGNTESNIFPILMVGISHYFVFQSSLNSTIQIFCTKENILKQIRINPLVLFSVSFFASVKKSLIFVLLVFLLMHLYNFNFYQNFTILTFIIYIINLFLLIVIAFSCALIFSVLHVYFRDSSKIVPVILRIMMYLTPVLYTMSYIKNKNLQILIKINPLAHIFDAFQWALIGNTTYRYTSLYWPFFFSIFMFYLSFLFFEKNKRKIIKNL